MPLLVNSVPNLAQGVSQQPDNLRYPGQCDEQINAWATVVEGLVKRPNTRYVGKLFTSPLSDDAYVQYIDRDENNRYAAVIDSNDVSVFDLADGTEKTVTITANAQTYLDGITNPRENVKALTVADYTFIANKEQTVSLGASVSPALPYEALVFVKLGDYSKEYSVEIDGQKFIYESGDGQNSAADSTGNSEGTGKDADTEYIAGQIAQSLGTGGQVTSVTITNGGSGYTTPPDVTFSNPATGTDNAEGYALLSGGVVTEVVVTHGGRKYTSAPTVTFSTGSATATATIAATGVSQTVEVQNACIKITGTSDFQIGAKDGLADQGLGLVYKEVGNITDLPSKSFHGFRVKVRGDTELVQDDYYVKFEVHDEEAFGEGTWIEDIGYGVKTEINTATMPLQLVPSADFNTWTLDTAAWTNRLVGDDDTNPAPTFVGSKINDIFFYKNRLGLLTNNSIVFSEADEYFNFWRTTVLQLLDSAPIDVGVSHTKVAILQHAVPFQEKLIIFSNSTQFVLKGADLLTPKTVSITPATEYDSSETIKPLVLNNYVYFNFRRNSYEGLTEYYIDNDTAIFDAAEITAQVPTYIPSKIELMAGTAVENLVVAVNGDRTTMFVYKFFWQNKEKIQSAWQKFTFARSIVSMGFIESDLYVITKDSTDTFLEKLPMENDLQDDNGYTILLDSRIDGSALTTSFSSGVTTISEFPYDPVDVEIFSKAGHKYAFTRTSATAGTVRGTLASYVDDGTGDYVTYEGSTYYCSVAHTSSSSFELQYWIKVSSGSGSAWVESTAYSAGTKYKCVHNASLNIQAHTSSSDTQPGVGANFSDYWQVSTDVTKPAIWVSGKLYNDDNYFFAGIPYNMLYRFSDQTLKQPTERGGRSASDYTFQTIRSGSLNYADTGHFTVEVTPKFRDTYTYAFNPDILGANLVLNSFTPQDGHFRFPVQCQPEDATIEVKSSSALPCKLLAAEFESMMIPRSKRYGS
jgi:hypothetical protein